MLPISRRQISKQKSMRLFDVKILFQMICLTGSSYTHLTFLKKYVLRAFNFTFFRHGMRIKECYKILNGEQFDYLNYQIQESMHSIKSFAAPLNTSLIICGTHCVDIIQKAMNQMP